MNSLSPTVVSQQGNTLISFERVATITHTLRVIKIMRLRRDLGLNLVGASMVLELAEENHRLRSQLDALRGG